jgi:hypothetical protein
MSGLQSLIHCSKPSMPSSSTTRRNPAQRGARWLFVTRFLTGTGCRPGSQAGFLTTAAN